MRSDKARRRLEKTDLAVELDALNAVSLRRQLQQMHERRGKQALKREVMHGDQGARAVLVAIAEIGDRKPALPIMRVENVGREGGNLACANSRRHQAERAKAQRVVGPILAVRSVIRPAGPPVEMRRINDDELDALRLPQDQTRRSAEQIVEFMDRLAGGQSVDDGGVAGRQRDDPYPFRQ